MTSRGNTCVYFVFRCSYTLATAIISVWIVQNSFDVDSIRSILPFLSSKCFTKLVGIIRKVCSRTLSSKAYTISRKNVYFVSFSEDRQGLKLHNLHEMSSQNPHRPKRMEQELVFKKQSRLQEREKYAKELNSEKLLQLEQELTSLKAQIQQFRALQTTPEFPSRRAEPFNVWQNEE